MLHSGINIETSNKTGDAYVSNAKAGSTFVQPSTTALSAPLAFASATPVIASGTAPAASSPTGTSGSNGTSASGSAAPSPTNAASGLQTSGFFAFVAAALGVAVL